VKIIHCVKYSIIMHNLLGEVFLDLPPIGQKSNFCLRCVKNRTSAIFLNNSMKSGTILIIFSTDNLHKMASLPVQK